MPKYFFLILATIWTALILYVCLMKASDVPSLPIVGIDKVVHFFMHLSFTFLWGMAFLKSGSFSKISKAIGMAFLLSLLFGLLIELFQGVFTTSRSADITDVFANILGALFAVAILYSNRSAFHSK